jgi:phosphohistidine phosphatase
MLTIWLTRHGEAVDPDAAGSDFARTLTPLGRQQVAGFVRWIVHREPSPELILHSPLVRARQTAEIIGSEFTELTIPIREERRLTPGIDTDELLSYLSSTAVEHVVCVGHQPDMSRCLNEMIGGGQIIYSPGTVACIEFTGPIMRSAGRLTWIVDPQWFA